MAARSGNASPAGEDPSSINGDLDPAAELERLRAEFKTVSGQVGSLKLSNATLTTRVRELEELLDSANEQRGNLAGALAKARDALADAKAEIEALSQVPYSYGVILGLVPAVDDTEIIVVDIMSVGQKRRVAVSPAVEAYDLAVGKEVILNERGNVIEVVGYEEHGVLVELRELLDDGRAFVVGHTDEEMIVQLAQSLIDGEPLKSGDTLLMGPKTLMVYERVAKPEVDYLLLEEVPDIDYEMIGGLRNQVEQIRDAIELPFLHADLFLEHELRHPKGVLLYGPPGCGKTLIAKAVANSLAKQVSTMRAVESGRPTAPVKAFFINIKGPELLNKYVGETERYIRLVFQRAREKATGGMPVIIFFDEMDSMFRTRGSGISSDIENTIVPMLLAEIDGVEGLENVIVIGATNREDMIDPAILRPGRLDVKIKVERPNQEGSKEILGIYLKPSLPIHPDELRRAASEARGMDLSEVAIRAAAVENMIMDAVSALYDTDNDENKFLEVTYAKGDKEIMYFFDFNSGAMLQNIVDRAKKLAIKEFLETGVKGIRAAHLTEAFRLEFEQNEDLPNTTNPDDWARISGKKGEPIVYIRTLKTGKDGADAGKSIDNVANTGQYL